MQQVSYQLDTAFKTVHKWDEKRATIARGQFGLPKKRACKPGKVHKNYTKKICPLITCGKTVLRLGNHLRQTDNFSDKNYIKMLVDAGEPAKDMIPDFDDLTKEGSLATTEIAAKECRNCEEQQNDIDALVMRQIAVITTKMMPALQVFMTMKENLCQLPQRNHSSVHSKCSLCHWTVETRKK